MSATSASRPHRMQGVALACFSCLIQPNQYTCVHNPPIKRSKHTLQPACHGTHRFEAESRRGEVLFRGTFAMQREGGVLANALDVYVKNTSNTNVVCWAGRCLSLFEAGQPYRLDPHTLQTQVGHKGCEQWGQVVQVEE